jgi:hypothetical protein
MKADSNVKWITTIILTINLAVIGTDIWLKYILFKGRNL